MANRSSAISVEGDPEVKDQIRFSLKDGSLAIHRKDKAFGSGDKVAGHPVKFFLLVHQRHDFGKALRQLRQEAAVAGADFQSFFRAFDSASYE